MIRAMMAAASMAAVSIMVCAATRATAPASTAAAAKAPPKAVSRARPGTLTDLTPDFIAFADETAALPEAERVKAFHARFDPLLPGYYSREGPGQARVDAMIAFQLKAFPTLRGKFTATAAAFGKAFKAGEVHFRKAFPDYRLTLPVYLVHSMGQQDGGTRTLAGRTILVFGADVIAAIHDETTIGPFLDHELLHAYHQSRFGECQQLWCALWSEGLATYVASRLNPGASDRALLLTLPRPIRREVEPRLAEAMCNVGARLESTSQDDVQAMFNFREGGQFPPRYGYFVGYVLAAKLGETIPLERLAAMPASQVKPLLRAAINSFGPCAAVRGRNS